MKLRSIVLLMLFLGSAPAPSPWHLEADSSAATVDPNGVVSIDAYLFNDGAVIEMGTLTIDAPSVFFPLSPVAAAGDVLPGHALHLRVRYEVASSAALGIYHFVVRGGGQAVVVTTSMGTQESAPPWRKVWMPIARG